MVEQALSVVNMKAIKMFFMGQAFFAISILRNYHKPLLLPPSHARIPA